MAFFLSLIVSILGFFRRLWTSIVGLLIFQDKPTALSQDIESGISTSIVSKQPAEDIDIIRESSSNVLYLAPSSGGFVDIDLGCTETIKCGHPNRRPGRRASSVDPLKSRIVDATLKHVQDKTINFIKTVTLTPSTAVIAHPCTAIIEYYDSSNDYSDRCGMAQRKTKGKPRTVQFVLPPIIVEDASTSSISTVSRDDQAYKSLRRHTEPSITDLVDQFPLPPAYVPPTPPLPAAIRYITENLRKFSAIRVYPSPMVEQESADSSETESNTSAYASESDSDATADTSAPGTPLSNNDDILSSVHFPAQAVLHDQAALSSVDISCRSAQCLKEEIHRLSVEDALALKSSHMPNPILADTSVLLVQPMEELDHHVSKINIQDPIERSYNVAESFNLADLQKDDIFDGKYSNDKSISAVTQDGLEHMLKNSPSEDAIVNDLLARLEISLEFDERRLASTPFSGTLESLLANNSAEIDKSDVEKSVTPLRIVKKNQVQLSVKDEEGDSTWTETSWEDSLEKVLQAFKDAESEDPTFRDLFCRDSSFLSQSSLVNSILGLPRYSNLLSDSDGYHDKRLKRLDESFESVEKSLEDFLAELELLPDTITIKTKEPATLNPDAAVIQEIMDNVMKPGPESVRLITSIAEDDEGDEEPYTWRAVLQDEEEEEVNSSEGEDSQWSDLLGLDVYSN